MKIFFLMFSLLACLQGFASTTLNVLTYNIFRKPEPLGLGSFDGRKRMKRLCEELKISPYDVVLVQEAWVAHERRKLKKCGYPYVLDMSEESESLPELTLESGLLILSRYPFVDSKRETFERRGSMWRLFRDGERLARKSFYASQIELPNGDRIWLVNTHLIASYCNQYPHQNCRSYEDVRADQLNQLADFVATLSGPVIFGGDLNMGPNPVAHDMIWDQMSDLFPGFSQAAFDPIAHATSARRNNFNNYELGKIDHLFGSDDFIISEGHIAYDQLMNIQGRSLHLSDHFGWGSLFHLP